MKALGRRNVRKRILTTYHINCDIVHTLKSAHAICKFPNTAIRKYYHPERASKALANRALVEFTLASCFSTSSCETIVFEIKGWSGFIYTEGSFISDNFPCKN